MEQGPIRKRVGPFALRTCAISSCTSRTFFGIQEHVVAYYEYNQVILQVS